MTEFSFIFLLFLKTNLRLISFPLTMEEEDRAILTFHRIPSLSSSLLTSSPAKSGSVQFRHRVQRNSVRGDVSLGRFACISLVEKCEQREFAPTPAQILNNPLAILALVPKDAAIFAAGAIAGAAAKTVTAPLDRVKLLMQVLAVPLLFYSGIDYLTLLLQFYFMFKIFRKDIEKIQK